jgi:heptaprenyl diphosphate synthase
VSEEERVKIMALLVAVASILQSVEGAILLPVLWMVRVGLANSMTILAILLLSPKDGVMVAVLRSILGAVIMGTFLTPTFFLSLCGATASALVMGFFYKYNFGLGLVGVSILGAITSNLVKLSIASIFLVQHMGLFFILPILMLSSLVSGGINGVVVLRLYKELSLEKGYGVRKR